MLPIIFGTLSGKATYDHSHHILFQFSNKKFFNRFQQESSDAEAVLNVRSLGHVLHAFVNGQAVGGFACTLFALLVI